MVGKMSSGYLVGRHQCCVVLIFEETSSLNFKKVWRLFGCEFELGSFHFKTLQFQF